VCEKTGPLLSLTTCRAAKSQYEACLHQYFILERHGPMYWRRDDMLTYMVVTS
jgi:hypothetical protein